MTKTQSDLPQINEVVNLPADEERPAGEYVVCDKRPNAETMFLVQDLDSGGLTEVDMAVTSWTSTGRSIDDEGVEFPTP